MDAEELKPEALSLKRSAEDAEDLRITRILKCLALRGLSREARAFRDFAV